MLLTMTRVVKQFGGLTAVSDVSFQVEEGEVFGIIGPNGAGKTTLFNLITGVYHPTEGTVTFDGTTLNDKKPHEIVQLGVARTFQNIRLFSGMTALENIIVAEHGRLRSNLWTDVWKPKSQREEESQARREAESLLEFVGLSSDGGRFATELPYGKQRKLEIARAMATNPKLILLDEPAAGMNDSETAALTELIRRIRAEKGMTVILIEHDMHLVMSLCDRLVVVNFGKKLAEGTPETVQHDPKVIEAYLGKEEG